MDLYNDSSLRERVVIITGASRGFGWFMAEKLLTAGARVVITASRTGAQLEAAQSRADALAGPGRCVSLVADVRAAEDCERTVATALEHFGRVDVLINNAGRGSSEYRATIDDSTTRFWDVPVEAWRAVIDTNLTGSFLMTRVVVPHMINQGFGKVFSISTSLTTMIMTGLSPYGASKAGLETAHVTWARELAPHGVDVNILLPGGAADTDFITQAMVPGQVGTRSRLLPGDVIVPPAMYLCSDASNGVTGRRIVAQFWDDSLTPADAFAACLQPQHDHPEIM